MDGQDSELSKDIECASKVGALSGDDQGASEDASKVKERTRISSSSFLSNSFSTSET
jgi:hypothetical protein